MKLLGTLVFITVFELSRLSLKLKLVEAVSNTSNPRPVPEVTNEDAMNFLRDLGFLAPQSPLELTNRISMSDEEITEEALRKFQQRYNLSDTGMLDDDTKRLLAAPRCEMLAELNYGPLIWSKRNLTYRIVSVPKSLDHSRARQSIRNAFEEWTKYADLNFREVNQGSADIHISDESLFHRNRQGQMCAFLRSTTLAHAFYPEVGDIHFNGARRYNEQEFFSLNLHEIGHSLGLDHSHSQSSIMFPMMISYHTSIPLEDQKSLRRLYGPRKNTAVKTIKNAVVTRTTTKKPTILKTTTKKVVTKPSTTRTTASVKPELCRIDKFDTIFNDAQGKTIVFAGEYYFESYSWNPKGRLISERWAELPDNIDVAFTYHPHQKTYFFKGSKLWIYSGNQLKAGYPKAISEAFPGLPDNISAAYISNCGQIMAFRKNQYWFYDPNRRPQVDSQYPRPVTDFKKMPSHVDAALFHTDGYLYFFTGLDFRTLNFYNFSLSDSKTMKNHWLFCK
ncbi:matrix metalloproteinase-19-like [Uranotaenia lowii]|uniref:matrix metalloproteinase-19-like n=1 Tax=Uranotaenia lowii TaxID=190385 RepID=UPI002479F52F|nr:matrix metalloproteinase-19-like [Uranotaenia lowii]